MGEARTKLLTVCPLCKQREMIFLAEVHQRAYTRCLKCQLISLAPQYHLSSDEEKSHYDHHQNNANDLGYRKFLNRLCDPLLDRISPNSQGLDFGCGPGPTLSQIMEQAGHTMSQYDPIYANEPGLLNGSAYDFITATEVFEHLHDPHKEMMRLLHCLKPAGILAVMTMHPPSFSDFENWHYIIDPTHVAFYSQETFHWMANHWDLSCEFPTADVTLLQRVSS